MECKEIIDEVRKTISLYFDGKEYMPKISGNGGVFVTLTRNGELRGCIGSLSGPLNEGLKMASTEAIKDGRFSPVTKEEMNRITIEVSLLSEPVISENPINELVIGKHGIIIRKGFQSGLLLPQVAIEHKLDSEEFLDVGCQKAGLPRGSWKEVDVFLFEAKIYKEGDMGAV